MPYPIPLPVHSDVISALWFIELQFGIPTVACFGLSCVVKAGVAKCYGLSWVVKPATERDPPLPPARREPKIQDHQLQNRRDSP